MTLPSYATVSAAVDLDGPLRAFLRAAQNDPALSGGALPLMAKHIVNALPHIIDGATK